MLQTSEYRDHHAPTEQHCIILQNDLRCWAWTCIFQMFFSMRQSSQFELVILYYLLTLEMIRFTMIDICNNTLHLSNILKHILQVTHFNLATLYYLSVLEMIRFMMIDSNKNTCYRFNIFLNILLHMTIIAFRFNNILLSFRNKNY